MRKGFTMVELLVVISIIGVLGATMMLSSRSASTTAKGMNVINNLRILKEAAAMYYLDNIDTAESVTDATTLNGDTGILKEYVDNPDSFSGYSFEITTDKKWYVKYDFSSDPDKDELKKRLKGRAKSSSLLKKANDTYTEYAGDTDTVYMRAR